MVNGHRAAGDGGGLANAKDTVVGAIDDAFRSSLHCLEDSWDHVTLRAGTGFRGDKSEPQTLDLAADATLFATCMKDRNALTDQQKQAGDNFFKKQGVIMPWDPEFRVAA